MRASALSLYLCYVYIQYIQQCRFTQVLVVSVISRFRRLQRGCFHHEKLRMNEGQRQATFSVDSDVSEQLALTRFLHSFLSASFTLQLDCFFPLGQAPRSSPSSLREFYACSLLRSSSFFIFTLSLLLTLISSDALSADYSQEVEINNDVVSFVLP